MMLGVSLLHPLEIMYSSNAFSTPLEILPEWYFLPSFNLQRIIQWKVIGVLSMIALIILMLSICLIENLSIYKQSLQKTYHDQPKLGRFSIWTMAWWRICTLNTRSFTSHLAVK